MPSPLRSSRPGLLGLLEASIAKERLLQSALLQRLIEGLGALRDALGRRACDSSEGKHADVWAMAEHEAVVTRLELELVARACA